MIGGAVLVAGALIFFGRGIGEGALSQTNTGGQGGSNQATALSASGENLAPDFTLTKLDGGMLSLSSYRGEKPVILDFFATWCPNCRRDMPKLSRWYEQYKDEVEVIGVNLHEREKTVQKFITNTGILFPVVLDPFSQVAQSYGVQYTNFHVLINKDGTLAGTVPGDISESQIVALIKANTESN